jgi:hypothetical protein
VLIVFYPHRHFPDVRLGTFSQIVRRLSICENTLPPPTSAFTRVFDAPTSAFTRVFDAPTSAFTRVFDALWDRRGG